MAGNFLHTEIRVDAGGWKSGHTASSDLPFFTFFARACACVCVCVRVRARVRKDEECIVFNLLKRTGHVMHQQFNIQQLYALPTLYLCVFN
jgi:hypothetical protein